MNRKLNKFLFLICIDIFLTSVDFVEAYDMGYIEDCYEEPYELEEKKESMNTFEILKIEN